MKEFTVKQTIAWLRTLEKRMSSGAVALKTEDDRVVVVKANYKRYWSLPGGVIDKGETPRVAAAREVHEEVGICVDPSDLIFKMVVDRVSTIAQTYQFVFEATITDYDIAQIKVQESEIEQVAIVTVQQIIKGDRYYSQSTRQWAIGLYGYDEQVYGAGSQADI
ncbi:NUDIX hydrolase [Candidatus Saccharibacteria bacterium]|nr:NUDIX hydrolase [Candidatus Saccharibacteria bacterium]